MERARPGSNNPGRKGRKEDPAYRGDWPRTFSMQAKEHQPGT